MPGREMEEVRARPGCFRYVLDGTGAECPVHGRAHDSPGNLQYASWAPGGRLQLRCFRGPGAFVPLQ